MIDDAFTRRKMLIASGGIAAGTFAAANGISASLAQTTSPSSPGPVRAVGQPMPGNVTFPATPPRKKRPDSIGIAIVGVGGYSLRQMMPAFAEAERAHIAAIVSGNPEKLRTVGDGYGLPADARYSYDRFDEIAADPRIDAVYIVLPSALHREFAERAFAAGKHVLCEKPMALTSADCAAMIAAATRANRKLMIAYRCHFEPHNVRAMELMRARATGQLRLIRTEQSYRMGPTTPAANWRVNRALAGGGPLEDLGIYGVQAALYLSGEMPQVISAATFQPQGDPRFAEIFAHVAAQWRFPSGAVAQLATSYDSQGTNFAHARGTDAALIMDPATNYGGQKMRLDGGPNAGEITPGNPQVQFAAQLDHLAAAIRDNAPIITPGEMGLRDVRIIEATYAAAASGLPVRLNPDGTMRA